jgi:hypothetical protein
VVREDLHLMDGAFTKPSPMFESIDNGEKFLVVDFVVYFRGLELPRVEGDRVQVVFAIAL